MMLPAVAEISIDVTDEEEEFYSPPSTTWLALAMMEDSYSFTNHPLRPHPGLLNAVVSFSVGQWVDAQLQPIAQSFPSYLMDSFVLKKQHKTARMATIETGKMQR